MSWAGKKVLVTGAGGFIGSHLAERLAREGAAVRAFVHYNGLGSRGWLSRSEVGRDIEFVAGDIADRDSVESAMAGCEAVFHLAALIAIPYSYEAPASYVGVNVVGTLNAAQAAVRHQVSRFVHTSTSEVYGTARYVPIDESHPLQGQSPYSATKIAADKLVEAFHCSFGLPAVTVRPFNTYGPRQSSRAIIPTIIGQALDGGIVHLGSLKPTRDLNFVSDTVEGFLRAAAEKRAIGRVINIGSGHEISIGSLAELVGSILGIPLSIASDKARLRPEKSEVERLLADNRIAEELLGWRPSVTLQDGLLQTIHWLRENRDVYRSHEYAI